MNLILGLLAREGRGLINLLYVALFVTVTYILTSGVSLRIYRAIRKHW